MLFFVVFSPNLPMASDIGYSTCCCCSILTQIGFTYHRFVTLKTRLLRVLQAPNVVATLFSGLDRCPKYKATVSKHYFLMLTQISIDQRF